jgi:hypothetical protein
MQTDVFHGILLDVGFVDPRYPETFSRFAQKRSGDWGLYGIEIPRDELENTVLSIQANMRADGQFYNHLYDDETLIVIFKTRVFHATPHRSSWDAIQQYGISLDIPIEQLDFWPNRFQDEIHYFGREDFAEQA